MAPEATAQSMDLGRRESAEPITVSLSLAYRDPKGMQRFVDSVSDPRSPSYRKFITPEEVGERFGPDPSTVNLATKFLTSNGMKIKLVGKNRLTVIAEGSVAQAEAAFHTRIRDFQPTAANPGTEGELYSFTTPLSVPKELLPYLVDVSGLDNFGKPQPKGYLTPPLAQTVYGLNPLFASNSKGQGRTIAISNWDGFRLSNVAPFLTQFGLPAPAGGAASNITVKTIDGGSGTGTQQGEADLDIQCILGVAPLCNLIIYDGKGVNLINVLTYEVNDNAADVISESWGWSIGTTTKTAAHNLHMSMSAQGITYMAASGDYGTNLGTYHYPAIDPEVLTVGGTTCNVTSGGVRISENGWSGSGGGWAVTTDTFNTLPSYQTGNGVPTNINYRLIPDVALNADPATGYIVYMGGSMRVFGGTSGASPTLAGALGDVQQQLIKNGSLEASGGKYRHGRIQDLIYALNGNSTIFFDVIAGANGTLPNGSASQAKTAWDFVTGWGVIDFNAFTTHFSGSGLASLTISPTSVEGGYSNATGTVAMVGLAPFGGYTISLSGGDSSISYPSSVTIPAGSSSVNFTITTSVVNSSVTHTLTATDNTENKTKTATLTLNPTSVTALTVTPTSVPGGTTLTGTVTLARVASGSGVPVQITGGDNKVSYSATVTVPSGSRTANFSITTSLVSVNTTETITATLGSTSKTASFTLTPLTISTFTFNPTTVVSGRTTVGTVTLSGNAPSGGVTVNIAGGDSSVSYPATVTVAAGSKTGTFTVSTSVIVGNKTETLSVTLGSSTKTASFTLTGIALSKLAFNPATVYGGQTSVGTVTLSQATGSTPVTLNLTSTSAAATIPATVTIAANSSTGTFTVSTSSVTTVTNVTISAALGTNKVSGTLTIRPTAVVSTLTFSPVSVIGGTSTTGTIKLAYGAGPGGATISITGGDSSISYPSTVTIPANGTQATFVVTTTPITTTKNMAMRAAYGSSGANGTFSVVGTAVSTFTIAPASVYGGQSAVGTVTLNGPAPTGGAAIVISGGTGVTTYSTPVTIAAGSNKATFNIATSSVTALTNVTLTATYGGAKTATLQVKPTGIVATLTFNPTSVIGGRTTVGTVKLSYAAGPGGVTVNLTGGDSSISYPSSVAIAAGGTQATFSVTTVPVGTTKTEALRAAIGSVGVNGSFSLVGTSLAGFTVAPTSVFGGQSLTGTVTLNGPAGTGGATVSLSGGDAKVSYPSTVTVAAGALTATFTITSSSVLTNTNETLTASFAGAKTAQFTLKPAGVVTSLSFMPTSAVGGTNATGTIKLSGPSGPGGVTVTLSGGDSSISYPATVTIPAGSSSANFVARLSAVATNTSETITATISPSFARGSITILAPTVSTFTIAPSSVRGGVNAVGTVRLTGVAPSSGLNVTISGGDATLTYSTTVTIPAGSSSATFTIATGTVASIKNFTLTARTGTVAKTAALKVTP